MRNICGSALSLQRRSFSTTALLLVNGDSEYLDSQILAEK